jgi:lipoate-protein ligase A
MRLIKNNDISEPGMNLALEEYCLQNLDAVNDYVLFYINQPSIIIGKHQNPFKECNVAYARKRGIQIVRRISGGGAVFQDHGNLNFSFITGFKKEKLDYFKKLLQPIIGTMHQLGVPAELMEKNNIVIESKKISGNSQYTNINRMLSHGTLLLDSDLDVLRRALTSNLDFIESKGVQSVKSDVTNISEYTDDSIRMNVFLRKLVEKFSECFGELKELKLTGNDWDQIYALSENKYKSWEWIYGKSPGFAVRHRFNYASQKIDAAVYVRHGMIEHIEFREKTIRQTARDSLLSKLIGQRYDPEF